MNKNNLILNLNNIIIAIKIKIILREKTNKEEKQGIIRSCTRY